MNFLFSTIVVFLLTSTVVCAEHTGDAAATGKRVATREAGSCEQRIVTAAKQQILQGIEIGQKNAELNEHGNDPVSRMHQLLGMCVGAARALGAAGVVGRAGYANSVRKNHNNIGTLFGLDQKVQDLCFDARLAAQHGEKKLSPPFDTQNAFREMTDVLSKVKQAIKKEEDGSDEQ